MKKTVYNLLSFVLAVSVFVCCSRRDENLQAPVSKHFFSIEAELPAIEQEPGSKASLESYISASWKADDKVSVLNLTTGKILGGELNSSGEGNRATFSGEVTGGITAGDMLALFYPSFGVQEQTDFGTRVMPFSMQSKTSNVPLIAYSAFPAESSEGKFSGLSLRFYYILSFLKINMSGLPAGAAVSSVTVRNVPDTLSLSINDNRDSLVVSDPKAGKATGSIRLEGSFNVSERGTMTASVAVMPSPASDDRSVQVYVVDNGSWVSPMTDAALSSDKYYNTIVSGFRKASVQGTAEYGVYSVDSDGTATVIDEYDADSSLAVCGEENGVSDFTLVNTSSGAYWKISGIPADVSEGDEFTIYTDNYGFIDNLPYAGMNDASVSLVEYDGQSTTLWIRSDDYLYKVTK